MSIGGMLTSARKIINPPYSKKDFLVILGVLVVLLAIPLTTFSVMRSRGIISEAGRIQPMSATALYVHRTITQPVEYQTPGGMMQRDKSLWVTNPTGCVWNGDDDILVNTSGYLLPGQVFSHTECVVADWAVHLIAVSAAAKKKRSVSC